MEKSSVNESILREKIIAVIRMSNADKAYEVAQVMAQSGLPLIEITLNTSSAVSLIARLSAELPDCIIGAGTVLTDGEAAQAIAGGARFLVSPIVSKQMIDMGKEASVVTVAGALTPNEIYQAHNLGADFIKPFPLAGIGPQYIKALKGPFPDIQFIPTNGVTLETMAEYFHCGAAAVGLGSVLTSDTLEVAEVERRCREALKIVKSL